MPGLSLTKRHLCTFKYKVAFTQLRAVSQFVSEEIKSYKSFVVKDEAMDLINNQPKKTKKKPPSLQHVSIIGKMLAQTDDNNVKRKETENNDIDSLKKRLTLVTDAAGETASTLKELEEAQESLTSETPNYLRGGAVENSVEVVAFKEDFVKTQAPTPLHGTQDENAKPSNTPCTGCGALLQCNNQIYPGFMVSEMFKMLSKRELKRSICQRCYYMRHGNAFVEVKVAPEEYEEMISLIRQTYSVVVMVVDLMDIRGSIIPHLAKYIGVHHPLIIVGNKADLIAPDGPDYLKKLSNQLWKTCNEAGLKNIKAVKLVSAKTGFGIEEMINRLLQFYQMKVDVYIVGTANSGKSSLFNVLLGSDYCRHAARDLIQRATVSEWPGTTLNLLKFPIVRASVGFETGRYLRLKNQKAQKLEDERLKIEQDREEGSVPETWNLTANVKTTDMRTSEQVITDIRAKAWGQVAESFRGTNSGKIKAISQDKNYLAMTEHNEIDYEKSYWAYDTPGIISPNQLMNHLKPSENTAITPQTMVVPRCVLVRAGMTLFVSGLGRIDILECEHNAHLTVHSSSALPIQVGLTEEAEYFYQEKLGTEDLMIPVMDEDNSSKLPGMMKSVDYEFLGDGADRSAVDIQLSSIGFVSVCANMFSKVKVRAWTPGAMGLHLRTPSMLPGIKAFRGPRIRGSYFYRTLPPGSALAGKKTVNVIDDKTGLMSKVEVPKEDSERKGRIRN